MTLYDPLQPTNLPPPNIGIQSVRANFSTYADGFDNNHVALNLNNQGKHTNVIMQGQVGDPSVPDGFGTLYSKSVVSASSTSQELFSRIPLFPPIDKNNKPIQLTYNSVNTTGSPFYQSFLPDGYVVYFGTIANATNIGTATTITLVPAVSRIVCVIPVPTKFVPISGLISAPVQISVTLSNSNFSTFTITSRSTLVPATIGDINWVAIAQQ